MAPAPVKAYGARDPVRRGELRNVFTATTLDLSNQG